jgi:predicted nucleic acid-binding protein
MAARAAKVFLDSNVLISGFISGGGPPGMILELLSRDQPYLHAATGRYNIIEIERNLAKKAPASLAAYMEQFEKLALTVVPMPTEAEVEAWPWPLARKDVPVLVSARSFGADFFVTGDLKHFEGLKAAAELPFRIVSPAEFLDSVLPNLDVLPEVFRKKGTLRSP